MQSKRTLILGKNKNTLYFLFYYTIEVPVIRKNIWNALVNKSNI